jgi:hypothetical protein
MFALVAGYHRPGFVSFRLPNATDCRPSESCGGKHFFPAFGYSSNLAAGLDQRDVGGISKQGKTELGILDECSLHHRGNCNFIQTPQI